MSNELQTIQNELTIAKQQNEIMQLRFKLEKTQAEKASRLEDSLFAPALYEHYQKVAITLSKSNVIPNIYKGKPEDIFVAMAMGYQLGFPVEQSLQDIAVINGRPCLWGDGLLSLCLNHSQCKSINENPIYQNDIIIGYECIVVRQGHEPHAQSFTLKDAERAGLLKRSQVWQSYPTRMLQMRARALALRDKFADALRGLRIAEIEDEDSKIIDAEVVTVNAPTQTEKLKKMIASKASREPEHMENVESITIEPENDAMQSHENQEKKVHNSGSDNIKADEEQLKKIKFLMERLGFDEERTKKAFGYYKIQELEDLSNAQAQLFITQLTN